MFESLGSLPGYPLESGAFAKGGDCGDILPMLLVLCGDNELVRAILLMLLA